MKEKHRARDGVGEVRGVSVPSLGMPSAKHFDVFTDLEILRIHYLEVCGKLSLCRHDWLKH